MGEFSTFTRKAVVTVVLPEPRLLDGPLLAMTSSVPPRFELVGPVGLLSGAYRDIKLLGVRGFSRR
jgi:hypothetical protein